MNLEVDLDKNGSSVDNSTVRSAAGTRTKQD